LKKTVETEDFRKSLERASGLNLSRFFDQWLYSKGYPKLKVEYKHDTTKNSVQITASQTQEDKKVGVPVFHATLKVGLGLSDGTVTVVSAEFNGDKAVLVTKLPEGVTVDYINVDPDVELLFSLDFNPGEDILKNTFVKGKTTYQINCYR
jgi:aminopeptidase N